MALIAVTHRPYEYRSEVCKILPPLLALRAAGELAEGAVTRIVHEAFAASFRPGRIGSEERYVPIAREILGEFSRP